MIVSLIAAMSEERVIGYQGKLPWHLPADLTRFKNITMGHPVIMGRKTYDSIGHPLPGRRNIVLSRSLPSLKECELVHSLQEALVACEKEEEVFICGGGEIFREAIPLCQRIYLTVVHERYPGDTFFPEIPATFQQTAIEERQDLTPPITFVTFERVDGPVRGEDVEELRRKGKEAIQRQLFFLGRICLEQASAIEESPECSSDLALCLAKSGGDVTVALKMAEEALRQVPDNPRVCLNLGRIQLLAGKQGDALATFRLGMQLGGGPELQVELVRIGTRREPVIPSLPRENFLNRYLGLLRSKIKR
ncbi:dihydrofolate reductase [Geomonas sp. Red276]